jgi:hypothetical protein
MAQILGVQCFLARAALGWRVQDLALASKVSWDSIARFARAGTVKPRTAEAIQRTLKNAGVIFIDANDGGPGVRMRRG